MRKYQVGIIGCGPRAAWHADALRHMEEVEIAGAADVREDRLNAFCDTWEIANRYSSSTQLLESQKLDLATIVTLPEAHLPLIEECAGAGVPVINSEKVIAYEIATMDKMLEAVRRLGSLLTVNHQMRFMEQFIAVRELANSGRLGELRFIRIGSRGNLGEQGTHIMDQALNMNNESPAKWVMGSADGAEGYERTHLAPSTVAASMEYENGVRGFIEAGMIAPEHSPESGFWLQKFIEVTGSKGWAGAYVNNGWRALLESGEVLSGPGTWEPNWPAQAELFRTGLKWIEDKSIVHPCRAENAAKGLEALLAICASTVKRGVVVLPLDRNQDPLRELKGLLGPGLGVTG